MTRTKNSAPPPKDIVRTDGRKTRTRRVASVLVSHQCPSSNSESAEISNVASASQLCSGSLGSVYGSKELDLPNTSKQAVLIELLKRQGGACLEGMMKATGWQAHSVRGFLSGTVRKKLGLNLISETIEGQRRYRIDGGAA